MPGLDLPTDRAAWGLVRACLQRRIAAVFRAAVCFTSQDRSDFAANRTRSGCINVASSAIRLQRGVGLEVKSTAAHPAEPALVFMDQDDGAPSRSAPLDPRVQEPAPDDNNRRYSCGRSRPRWGDSAALFSSIALFEFRLPLRDFVRLVDRFVKFDESLNRFDYTYPTIGRQCLFTLLQSVVALPEEQLGLFVFLLA